MVQFPVERTSDMSWRVSDGVGELTDRPTDRPIDRQTDRRTDIVAYRIALSLMKLMKYVNRNPTFLPLDSFCS